MVRSLYGWLVRKKIFFKMLLWSFFLFGIFAPLVEAASVYRCHNSSECASNHIDYLLLAADVLRDTIDALFNSDVYKLAEHRVEYDSLNVGIVSTKDIKDPPENITNLQIRDFIKTVYDNASAEHMEDSLLAFVLLVGDVYRDDGQTYMVQTKNYDADYEKAADVYYACLTESAEVYDDFPDLMLGRLSVGDSVVIDSTFEGDSLVAVDTTFVELHNVVEKIVNYEPLPADSAWRYNILAVSGKAKGMGATWEEEFDYVEQEILPSSYTMNRVIEGVDSAPRDSIITNINRGQLIVNYAGHGRSEFWRWNTPFSYLFGVNQLPDLSDSTRLHVMINFACNTGRFDNEYVDPPLDSLYPDCMAERFVNEKNVGAIGCMACTRETNSGDYKKFIYPIWESIFWDHHYMLGEILTDAKIEYLIKEGKTLYLRNYNLFGDPATNIMWDAEDTLSRPDLSIARSRITQIPLWPNVGDTVTIQAVVENKGLADADTAFTVQFFYGHPDSGGQAIGETQIIDSLLAWHKDSVQVNWPTDTLKLGDNKIYVRLDSADVITEIYETNNLNWNKLWVYLYQKNFPDTVHRIDRSNPAVVNVTGSSDQDILMARNCWTSEGVAWSCTTYRAASASSPAIGDLDNDGDQEVVLSFRRRVVPNDTLRSDSLFIYQQESEDYAWGSDYKHTAIYGSPSLGYLDGDDTLDIVFCLSSQNEYQDTNRVVVTSIKNDTLQVLWEKVVNTYGEKGALRSSPAIGDIDSDGRQEIVVLSDSGYVYAFNGESGDTVWTRQIGGVCADNASKSAPVLADIDGDGQLEIVARTNEDSLVILKGENGADDVSPRYYLGDADYSRSPCIGDVDQDGDLEIIFQADSTLFVLSSSLTLDASAKIPEARDGVRSPVLADLNLDGDQEIIVAAGDTLYVFESDADTFLTIPLIAGCGVSPAVGDIDGDGDAEIISGAPLEAHKSIIHVCDYWGTLGEIDWGMFHHDPRRTGCYAQPMLGDTISTDKIWSGNVVIHGDVVVDTGATLTIEPGTRVEFDTTDSQSSGEDTTRCELIVYGTLKAAGTEADSIIITSHAVSPSKSDWYGIMFKDHTSNASQVEYCQIDYAHKGISCYKCSVDVKRTAISHCAYGAYVDSSGTKLRMSHVRCDSCSYGARIQLGAAKLDTCVFEYNDYGVSCDASTRYYLYQGPGSSVYEDFMCCEFSYNSKVGVLLSDSKPIINHCQISHNGKVGLKCLDASDPIVGYDTLSYNGGTSGTPPVLTGTGLHCTGTSSPIVVMAKWLGA